MNCFFIAYMFSPRFCHRFVGYLEEEAVKTYTYCLKVSEFYGASFMMLPTNTKVFLRGLSYLKILQNLSKGYRNPKRKLGVTMHF